MTKKGYTANIEKLADENMSFRRVLYTAQNCQLVLMSLKPGEEIGNEVHSVDQFFRFEKGHGKAILNQNDGASGEEHVIGDGDVLIVPAGTWHNIINTSSDEYMKLYTVYAPPHHRDGVVHQTNAEGEADKTDVYEGLTTE